MKTPEYPNFRPTGDSTLERVRHIEGINGYKGPGNEGQGTHIATSVGDAIALMASRAVISSRDTLSNPPTIAVQSAVLELSASLRRAQTLAEREMLIRNGTVIPFGSPFRSPPKRQGD